MKVKILRITDSQAVDAQIVKPSGLTLPSITDGWRFNFKKHSKKVDFQTYILVTEETPKIIEGCLIFQLRDTVEPYMAYVELAPHNKGQTKTHDRVAGCLIAFACRLSFLLGVAHFKGWLTFDVMEENKEDEIKLMAVYCTNYGALKWGEKTMVISPEVGEQLITKFLNQNSMKSKEIQLAEIWDDDKRSSLNEFITNHSQKQSEERKLRNELLAIQYRIEDYIESESTSDRLRILDFVKLYLQTFNVTQKKLADLFEMKDSNLHKYLVGERKLNTSMVLKLSSFSHLNPEYWLRVEVKNELIEITKEKEKSKEYEKYDYRNLLVASDE